MKIGLIGFGVVGQAAHHTFSKRFEIVIFDKYLEYTNFELLIETDFVFIMVPTPFDCEKNQVDNSAVLESLERYLDHFNNKPILKAKFSSARSAILPA